MDACGQYIECGILTDQDHRIEETNYHNTSDNSTSSGSDNETSSSSSGEEGEEIDSENMSDSDCEKRLLGSERDTCDDDSDAWDSEDWDGSSEEEDDDELTEAVEQVLQIQITHPPITAREVTPFKHLGILQVSFQGYQEGLS